MAGSESVSRTRAPDDLPTKDSPESSFGSERRCGIFVTGNDFDVESAASTSRT
jgi:hypothetical protein